VSLLNPILAGIVLSFLIIPFNGTNAQIRVHSSEGAMVIGGTSEDFEKAGSKQRKRDWHRVYTLGEQDREHLELVEKQQEKKDVYLFATGYYHPEQGQDFYATGSYEKDLRLNGQGVTATGKKVSKGHVAVDPSVIPLGTEFYSEEHGMLKAEDTGGRIRGNRIDIFTGDGENGLIKARKINGWAKLRILKWGKKRSSDTAAVKGSKTEHQGSDMTPVARFSTYKDYQRSKKGK